MAFPSKFNGGYCPKCFQPILQGQYINWTRRGVNAKRAWHENCANPYANPAGNSTSVNSVTVNDTDIATVTDNENGLRSNQRRVLLPSGSRNTKAHMGRTTVITVDWNTRSMSMGNR